MLLLCEPPAAPVPTVTLAFGMVSRATLRTVIRRFEVRASFWSVGKLASVISTGYTPAGSSTSWRGGPPHPETARTAATASAPPPARTPGRIAPRPVKARPRYHGARPPRRTCRAARRGLVGRCSGGSRGGIAAARPGGPRTHAGACLPPATGMTVTICHPARRWRSLPSPEAEEGESRRGRRHGPRNSRSSFSTGQGGPRGGRGHGHPDREDHRLRGHPAVSLRRRVRRPVPVRAAAVLVPAAPDHRRVRLRRPGPPGGQLPAPVRSPGPPRRLLRPRHDPRVR